MGQRWTCCTGFECAQSRQNQVENVCDAAVIHPEVNQLGCKCCLNQPTCKTLYSLIGLHCRKCMLLDWMSLSRHQNRWLGQIFIYWSTLCIFIVHSVCKSSWYGNGQRATETALDPISKGRARSRKSHYLNRAPVQQVARPEFRAIVWHCTADLRQCVSSEPSALEISVVRASECDFYEWVHVSMSDFASIGFCRVNWLDRSGFVAENRAHLLSWWVSFGLEIVRIRFYTSSQSASGRASELAS